MLPLISDFLMLSDEPALLARGGRVLQANRGAEELLGRDCVGQSVRQLFGDAIAGAQASQFVAELVLRDRQRTVRISRLEGGMQLIFLSREDRDLSVLNDASLAAMRGCLMNLSLGTERGRLRAEQLADAPLADCFAAITKQYYLLNRLISNAAVVYSLLRGELPLALTAVDLAALCRSTAETLSLLRAEPEIRVSAPPTLLLNADEKLLETLLLNLLSNALLHAEGLSLVQIRLMETEKSVVLSVSDDGGGIPAEALPTVFSRYRHGFEMSALPLSAGLGLTVARGVACRHGGTLLLESRVGQGTTVRVSLSRNLGGQRLCTPAAETRCDMSALLTGLACCLPDECYQAKYLD